MRIIAIRMSAATVLAWRSKSRDKRRLRLIHANVRSTNVCTMLPNGSSIRSRRHFTGTVAVAVMQGALGGLIFWLFGPAGLLLGPLAVTATTSFLEI
jgi:hypothetical protein